MANGGNWPIRLGTTGAIITVRNILSSSLRPKDAFKRKRCIVLTSITQPDTLTGKTQWTRPGGDAFVIPLGLIQVS